MKRKLLEASLLVAGTSLFFRIVTAIAYNLFPVSRDIRYWNNAVLVAALGTAVPCSLALLLPHVSLKRPRLSWFNEPIKRSGVKIVVALVGAYLLVMALFAGYGFVKGLFSVIQNRKDHHSISDSTAVPSPPPGFTLRPTPTPIPNLSSADVEVEKPSPSPTPNLG